MIFTVHFHASFTALNNGSCFSVANPMPILLQEPLGKTSLKGENVTFECHASAMYTAPQNFTHTTTTPNPGLPLLEDLSLHDTMGDAPIKPSEPHRTGGFPLKADPHTPPEKKKSHKRRNANRQTKGVDVMWKRNGKVSLIGQEFSKQKWKAGYLLKLW